MRSNVAEGHGFLLSSRPSHRTNGGLSRAPPQPLRPQHRQLSPSGWRLPFTREKVPRLNHHLARQPLLHEQRRTRPALLAPETQRCVPWSRGSPLGLLHGPWSGSLAQAPRAAGVGLAAPAGQGHVHYLALVFNDTGLGAWPLKASYFGEVCVRWRLIKRLTFIERKSSA